MSEQAEYRVGPEHGAREPGPEAAGWDAARVRRLRSYLDASQSELAERLGTRQQTVSEWETGQSRPRRMSQRLLHLVAEEAGFYTAEDAVRAERTGAAGAGDGSDAGNADGEARGAAQRGAAREEALQDETGRGDTARGDARWGGAR